MHPVHFSGTMFNNFVMLVSFAAADELATNGEPRI